MKEFWNERYSAKEYVYGTDPNTFFKEQIDNLPPGKILLPAEGEGRNAVYAASIGWEVDAYDISEKAKKKALALAETRNIRIQYDVADIMDVSFPTKGYDAVGLFFVHFPPDMRTFLHEQCVRALRKGGHIILEAFSKKQLHFDTGGPKDISKLYSLSDLINDFSGMKIKIAESVFTDFEEGSFHLGKAAVVRLVLEKK